MGLFDPNVTNETITGSSSNTPWAAQQPYLTFGFDQAKQLYDYGGPQYYSGNTYTPFAPQTNTALGMIEDRALAGSSVNTAASQMAADTLGGVYFDNPYLDDVVDRSAGVVKRGVDSMFSGAGRYGSGINQDILEENLGDMASGIYNTNYQNERNRQLSMTGLAPMIANQEYADANRLLGVGGIVQDQADRVLQSDINRWNYNQNLPYTNLEMFNRNISGDYGGTTSTTQTQPLYSNSTAQNLLGVGLTGAGLLANADTLSKGWDIVSGWF